MVSGGIVLVGDYSDEHASVLDNCNHLVNDVPILSSSKADLNEEFDYKAHLSKTRVRLFKAHEEHLRLCVLDHLEAMDTIHAQVRAFRMNIIHENIRHSLDMIERTLKHLEKKQSIINKLVQSYEIDATISDHVYQKMFKVHKRRTINMKTEDSRALPIDEQVQSIIKNRDIQRLIYEHRIERAAERLLTGKLNSNEWTIVEEKIELVVQKYVKVIREKFSGSSEIINDHNKIYNLSPFRLNINTRLSRELELDIASIIDLHMNQGIQMVQIRSVYDSRFETTQMFYRNKLKSIKDCNNKSLLVELTTKCMELPPLSKIIEKINELYDDDQIRIQREKLLIEIGDKLEEQRTQDKSIKSLNILKLHLDICAAKNG